MNIQRLFIVTLFILLLTVLTIGHDPAGYGLMSPLLPVAAISGHSGLLTAGFTGVALLKLKAAAGIAYWLSLRKHRRGWGKGRGHKGHHHPPKGHHKGHHHHPPKGHHHHPPKGHHHEGWGWDERRHHHHQHRRAGEAEGAQKKMKVPSVDKPTVDMSEYDLSLDEVIQYDQLGCGMRLVCELSATPEETLLEDERLILDLFGRDGKVPNAERTSRGKLNYSYAALLGSHSKESKVCSTVYGRCPYTAKEIMFSLRDINI